MIHKRVLLCSRKDGKLFGQSVAEERYFVETYDGREQDPIIDWSDNKREGQREDDVQEILHKGCKWNSWSH